MKIARPGIPTWLKVVIGLGVGMFALNTCSALAVYGTRGYLTTAKMSEAKGVVGAISSGMVACMSDGGPTSAQLLAEPGDSVSLPPTTRSVPSSVPKGTKYQSSASDWTSPAFRCARFSLTTPQYFQYEWEQVSPTVGVVHARGDLDGDGKVEADVSQEIRCSSPKTCTAGALVIK
jgi:hypothetical protein